MIRAVRDGEKTTRPSHTDGSPLTAGAALGNTAGSGAFTAGSAGTGTATGVGVGVTAGTTVGSTGFASGFTEAAGIKSSGGAVASPGSPAACGTFVPGRTIPLAAGVNGTSPPEGRTSGVGCPAGKLATGGSGAVPGEFPAAPLGRFAPPLPGALSTGFSRRVPPALPPGAAGAAAVEGVAGAVVGVAAGAGTAAGGIGLVVLPGAGSCEGNIGAAGAGAPPGAPLGAAATPGVVATGAGVPVALGVVVAGTAAGGTGAAGGIAGGSAAGSSGFGAALGAVPLPSHRRSSIVVGWFAPSLSVPRAVTPSGLIRRSKTHSIPRVGLINRNRIRSRSKLASRNTASVTLSRCTEIFPALGPSTITAIKL